MVSSDTVGGTPPRTPRWLRRVLGAIVMVLLAAAGGLALSGVAYAEGDTAADAQHAGPAAAGPAEVVDGECAATVLDERGRPLLVDADALLVDGGLPAVRLGSSTDRIAEEEAVDLPVGDVVESLGVGEAPVVGEVAAAGCGAVDTTSQAVTSVAVTTHTLTAPVQAAEPEPERPAKPQRPAAPEPQEVPEVGGEEADPLPINPQAGPLLAAPVADTLPLGPLPRVEVPLPDAAA
ncbi:MAG: hypothetical protein ACRDQF_06685, partial [Thermocrispum sp.]